MKLAAGRALARVLASWDVKHIYGIPGSSVNGLMDALYEERDKITYIQVRHESAGAMAASGYAKTTGKIGVCYGSAAPGATNLINGLYDAKLDRVPLLAIVGQTATQNMNTTYFQEMDEVPLYADVSVYNRCVSNARQIPAVVEEAIRTAYAKNGVAVVILPNDLVEEEIEYIPRRERKSPPPAYSPEIDSDDMTLALQMIMEAKRPVLYGGLGLKGARDVVTAVSEKLSMPIVTSASAIGIAAPNNHKNFMGSFGRLGTKAAYEVMNSADLVLFIGSNFPFARNWPKDLKVIQVNNAIEDISKQIPADLAILADGKSFLEKLLKANLTREETPYLKAARKNKENWENWLNAIADDDSQGLTPEGVLKAVRTHATSDAFFGLDVGNNTMHSIRMLPLYENQRHVLSGWFASLGVGAPYSIAAKLTSPERQVWSISGDGGFAMNMQEIITQTRYQLPIINIVISDQSYGFIQHAQIQKEFLYGVDITDVDWATTARGMGAIGFTARNLKELETAMTEIDTLQNAGNKKPILLDAKVRYFDPIDTGNMIIDPDKYRPEEIEKYKSTYNLFDQPPLSKIIKNKLYE